MTYHEYQQKLLATTITRAPGSLPRTSSRWWLAVLMLGCFGGAAALLAILAGSF